MTPPVQEQTVTEREATLRKLDAGDVFHATAPNGASLICLTLRATKFSIHAKRITTQSHHAFDPVTGMEQSEPIPSIIDSVARLPPDILEALLGLDRVYSRGWQEEHHKLTSEEKRALLFIGGFYRAHPLPG
jgi:hypothetical protein